MILSHSTIAIRMAAEHGGVTVGQLRGRQRRREVVYARWAAMYALHRIGFSYPMIGRAFSKDHSSVMYGVSRVEHLPAVYRSLAARIEEKLHDYEPQPLQVPAYDTDYLVAA